LEFLRTGIFKQARKLNLKMVKNKPVTGKIGTVVKNDKRYKPKKTPIFKPSSNGNPLIDPNHPGVIPDYGRKGLSKKEVMKFMRSNQGFSVGLSKYDKRDIISIKSARTESDDQLTKKITSIRLPKREKEKPAKILRDNGAILSQASLISGNPSLKGIAKPPTKNKVKDISKNKPIARRDKLNYKPRLYETVATDSRKQLTKPPTKVKADKKFYKMGMKHVKGKGQIHTPFYVPLAQKELKHAHELPSKITGYNPTGTEIKEHKISSDTVFGDAPKKKVFKRPSFHMASYSQINFAEMGGKKTED